jgi:tyrosine-protein phosphatase SIW14
MAFLSRFPVFVIVLTLPLFAASAPGIKNFDHVDPHVYRGGQPTDEGIQYLAQLGVKTIVDLREAGDRSKAEQFIVTKFGMKYVNVPMSGLTPPTDAEITRLLAILEDTTGGPVFVHCWRGADRTGAVIAAYHIDHDHWDNAHALSDARAHKMSSLQFPRQNYIKTFRARTPVATTVIAGETVTVGTAAAN